MLYWRSRSRHFASFRRFACINRWYLQRQRSFGRSRRFSRRHVLYNASSLWELTFWRGFIHFSFAFCSLRFMHKRFTFLFILAPWWPPTTWSFGRWFISFRHRLCLSACRGCTLLFNGRICQVSSYIRCTTTANLFLFKSGSVMFFISCWLLTALRVALRTTPSVWF